MNISVSLDVSVNQSLYLVSLKEGMNNVTIDSSELINLIENGHVTGNSITPETLVDINTICKVNTVASVKKQTGVVYPKLTAETAEITKKLAKHFLGDMLTGVEFGRIESYVPNNVIQVPFLFMFMQMFPSSVKGKNKHWDKKFAHEWDNVTLRRLSVGTANKFKQIWKTRDIGLFLLGTYLFIQNSYDAASGKFFLKSIEKYLNEYQTWYETAEDNLRSGKLDHLLVKHTHSSNTFVPNGSETVESKTVVKPSMI